MALAFPLVPIKKANQTNGNLLLLPNGGVVAKALAHCVLDKKDIAGHAIQINDIRCYGPIDGKPEGESIAIFNQFQFVDGPFIDNPAQIMKAWNDPTGTLTTIKNNLLPWVIKFSRPTDGSNANSNFLQAFQTSWVNMVTAGYRETGKGCGKLGCLTNF